MRKVTSAGVCTRPRTRLCGCRLPCASYTASHHALSIWCARQSGVLRGFGWAELAFVYSAQGNRSQAQRIANQLESRSRKQYISAYSPAVASVAIGDKNGAIARLQKSVG